MDSTQIIIIVAIVLFFLIKHLSQVSPEKARSLYAEGALILDVRTADEFAGGHLENAINIPVDEVSKRIKELGNDKEKAILVYCLSGTRSGFAVRILKGLNFSRVYNLGSIYRARAILK